jgi:hypothetical protein
MTASPGTSRQGLPTGQARGIIRHPAASVEWLRAAAQDCLVLPGILDDAAEGTSTRRGCRRVNVVSPAEKLQL